MNQWFCFFVSKMQPKIAHYSEGCRILSSDDHVTNSWNSIGLLLRRSIQVSLRYSTETSQFTQSEAKGRTLVPQQLYSTFGPPPIENIF